MEKQYAQRIIKELFESAFNQDNYTSFLSELLEGMDYLSGFGYITGGQIAEKFRNKIASYKRIGKYKTDDKTVELLVVKLNNKINLDQDRASLRNFIVNYLDGGRGGVIRDAALVAFIEPDNVRWRLSLVCLQTELTTTNSGNLTVEKKATSAKRYSYILGHGEPSHTAQQKILPYLMNNKHPITLVQLESIFAVEALSDEFFAQYVQLLDKTKNVIVNSVKNNINYTIIEQVVADKKSNFSKFALRSSDGDIDVGNFAKKLLGQIVFLYFLQKKGWLGVDKNKPWGTGDKSFMRSCFNKINSNENYFNTFLESLFYEALASERPEDYSTLFECKIPFLNGGLFDKFATHDCINKRLELPNDLFGNSEAISIGKNSIEVIGTGILDVFDRYNFTVCEDEPLEKEVAIDPEMLGKIFENTIEDNERKGKGAFYTPRQIVHYMVKRSLIEYLASKLDAINQSSDANLVVKYDHLVELVDKAAFYLEHEQRVVSNGKETATYEHLLPKSIVHNALRIDELLASITILDPAVGSGAFPVGLLIELVKVRYLLQIYGNSSKSMYELKYHAITNSIYGVDIDDGAIDVARLRLWLSLVVDENDFAKIQPLPNLDYKLIVGNSLMHIDAQDMFLAEKTDRLAELEAKFVPEFGHKRKDKLKLEINELLKDIMGDSFDFRYVFGKYKADDGFDIVIGNPPYVGEKGDKDIFQSIKASQWGKLHYQRRMDLFYFFFHLGIKVAKINGIISFITTNYYITADGAYKLRQDLKLTTKIKYLINFNEVKLFESALGQHNMVTILQKNINNQDNYTNIIVATNDKRAIVNNAELNNILNGTSDSVDSYTKIQRQLFDGDKDYNLMALS